MLQLNNILQVLGEHASKTKYHVSVTMSNDEIWSNDDVIVESAFLQ